jgi:hypothetical protein
LVPRLEQSIPAIVLPLAVFCFNGYGTEPGLG